MKMLFVVVHNEDAHDLVEALNNERFQVTKLCSTGGFLRSGNTTLLMGVEAVRVEEALEIIKNKSKSRMRQAPPLTPMGFEATPHMFAPLEVMVGGATVFIIDVERMEKY